MGRVRLTEFTSSSALLLCSLLDLYLWNVHGTFSYIFYIPVGA